MKSRFTLIGLLFSLISFHLNAQNFWQEVHTGNFQYPTIKTSSGGITYTTTNTSLVSTSDNGITWNNVYNINWWGAAFAVSPTGVIYISADSLRRSYDEGLTWETLPGNIHFASLWFLVSNSEGDLFTETGVLAGSYSFRSDDDGETWVKIGIAEAFMNSIAFHPSGITYAVYEGNLPPGKKELYRSTNQGDEWTEVTTAPENIAAVYCTNNGDIFAAQWLTPALQKSTDGGTTWTQIFSQKVNFLAENQEGELFITVDNAGVYRSIDNGATWEEINTGLTLTDVSVLDVDSLGYLYVMAGTDNNNQTTIYRSIEPTIGTVDVRDPVSEPNFFVEQNYPNPFNPATVIKYQIPKDGFVSVKVLDIIGSEIATLVNENQTQGRYEINFNAGSLASGVYLYRIQSGEYVNTKKMMLLK